MPSLWSEIDSQLAKTPLEAEVKRNDFYSEPEWDIYEVRYSGVGGYRLFAWMSVPKGDGPFPGIVIMPDYASAVSIPFGLFRFQGVVINPSYRGQRRSDHAFQASYPGLLTHDIDDSDKYVMKSIYADGLRAIDLLLSRPEVDTSRVAMVGHGLGGTLGLIAAALRPQVNALVAEAPLMVGPRQVVDLASGYPLEELKDYLRRHPRRKEKVYATLQRYSILPLAKHVEGSVLLALGMKDTSVCPVRLGERLAAAIPKVEVRRYVDFGAEAGGHIHRAYRDMWVREKLGIVKAISVA
jgi:cephalosporin-C deacetylase